MRKNATRSVKGNGREMTKERRERKGIVGTGGHPLTSLTHANYHTLMYQIS